MNYDAIALWSEILSSVLFVVALVAVWTKFIQPAVLRAQETQNARIAEAERHRDEARASLDVLSREIETAHADAEAMNKRVAAQAAIEREAILQEAREAGQRAIDDAQQELPRARAAARDQLRDELAAQALERAREDAARRIDPQIDRKLVTAFVSSLEKT